jgi:hypothetical protein
MTIGDFKLGDYQFPPKNRGAPSGQRPPSARRATAIAARE